MPLPSDQTSPDERSTPDTLHPDQTADKLFTPSTVSSDQNSHDEPSIILGQSDDVSSMPGTLHLDQTSLDDSIAPSSVLLDHIPLEKFSDRGEIAANTPLPDNSISSHQLATSDAGGLHLNVNPPGPDEKRVNLSPTPIKEGSLPFFRPWCPINKSKLCCQEDINPIYNVYQCVYCKTTGLILPLALFRSNG